MTYRGHVENGAVILDSPCALPEGTLVSVAVLAPYSDASRPDTLLTLAMEIQDSIPEDAWNSLPEDGAMNVDHYLYGAPKKQA